MFKETSVDFQSKTGSNQQSHNNEIIIWCFVDPWVIINDAAARGICKPTLFSYKCSLKTVQLHITLHEEKSSCNTQSSCNRTASTEKKLCLTTGKQDLKCQKERNFCFYNKNVKDMICFLIFMYPLVYFLMINHKRIYHKTVASVSIMNHKRTCHNLLYYLIYPPLIITVLSSLSK